MQSEIRGREEGHAAKALLGKNKGRGQGRARVVKSGNAVARGWPWRG